MQYEAIQLRRAHLQMYLACMKIRCHSEAITYRLASIRLIVSTLLTE